MKLGCATTLSARLSTYNTGSPYRDYSIFAAAPFKDYRDAELTLMARLRGHRVGNTEWFQLHPQDARNHLQRLAKQEYSE